MLSVSDNTYNMYDCCGNIGGILGEGIKLLAWVEPFQSRPSPPNSITKHPLSVWWQYPNHAFWQYL
jgi:hypothetical protein